MLQGKFFLYFIGAILAIGTIFTIVNNVKDYFKEPTYTKEAVELMLKHQKLKREIESLLIENQIIEKDNERLKQNITSDSITIWSSSIQFRDSIREYLNPR